MARLEGPEILIRLGEKGKGSRRAAGAQFRQQCAFEAESSLPPPTISRHSCKITSPSGRVVPECSKKTEDMRLCPVRGGSCATLEKA